MIKLRFTNRQQPIAQVLQSIWNKCQIPYCKQFKPFLITSCLGRPFFNLLSLPWFFPWNERVLKVNHAIWRKNYWMQFFLWQTSTFLWHFNFFLCWYILGTESNAGRCTGHLGLGIKLSSWDLSAYKLRRRSVILCRFLYKNGYCTYSSLILR